MTITAYLFFDGQTEAAFNFYHEIFGGSIEMVSRYGDVPNDYPEEYKTRIMHARLIFDSNTIMFSDVMPGEFKRGDGFSLAIGLEKDEEKANKVFEKLSEGGVVTMPLQKQFWGALYGQVTDQFGVQWMVNCNL